MKLAAFALLVVWLFGAVGMTAYYAVADREGCVEREGLIKGLLWCESAPKTRLGQSASHTSRFLKGAIWPIHLIQKVAQSDLEDRSDRAFQSTRYTPDKTGWEGLRPDQRESVPRKEYAPALSCQQWVAVMDHPSGGIIAAIKIMEELSTNDNDGRDRILSYAFSRYGQNMSEEEAGNFMAMSVERGKEMCRARGSMSATSAILTAAFALSDGVK